MTELAFAVLATLTLGGAVGVVTARSVFVSALWLILSFFGVAGLYLSLGASFLGIVQVLIYVGAISVLILFAVMLTPNLMEGPAQLNRQSSLALAAALMVFGLLATLGFGTTWQTRLAAVPPVSGVVVATPGADAPAPVAEQARVVPYAAVTPGPDGQVTQVLPDPTMMLGKSFVSDQLLAFEVISVILLVALMGAIIIARD